jgi:Lhr-like helicase
MKTCSCCKLEKIFTEFNKNKKSKDGYQSICRNCSKEHYRDYYKQYYERVRENKISSSKKYYEENRSEILESRKEYQKQYYENNIEKILEYYQKNKDNICIRNKKYRESNKDKILARNAKRRADKIKATPKWLSKEQLLEISFYYWLCNSMSEDNDVKYHVDHIVPLRGKDVCGLHVPWNLQILEASDNIRKSNKLLQ